MDNYIEVGAYEAKSHFPEFLRKAKSGTHIRITNRGEHVADLVPPGAAESRRGVIAAERMQHFVHNRPTLGEVDFKALMEEGRD